MWRQWRDDADAAAAGGQSRGPIHFAYWSAIAFLETEGAWRPDATRTPREYVRLLPDAAASRASLTALTRLLEHVWYGTRPASAADFERAQVSLEETRMPLALNRGDRRVLVLGGIVLMLMLGIAFVISSGTGDRGEVTTL